MSFKAVAVETAISVLRRIGEIASNVWQYAKKLAVEAEELGIADPAQNMKGAQKYEWAVTTLVSLFPSLNRGWAGLLVQAAWLLWESRGWDTKSKDVRVEPLKS